MPTIKRMGQTPMQSRVYTERVDYAQGSATATALANVGAEGAKMATALLQERKTHESKVYAQRNMDGKAEIVTDTFKQLSKVMDPATGRIVDPDSDFNGQSINEAMASVEKSLTEDIKRDAPTEQAKRMVELRDLSATQKRMFAVDVYKTTQALGAVDETFKQSNDVKEKNIRKYEADFHAGVGVVNYTNSQLMAMKAQVIGTSVWDVNQKRKKDRQGGERLAVAGMDRAVNGGHWGEVALGAKIPFQLQKPKARDNIKQYLNKAGYNIIDIKPTEGGYNLVHGEKGRNGKNLVTFMDMGPLIIGAEKDAKNLVHDYMSPRDVQKYTRAYLDHFAKKKNKLKTEALRSQQGALAAMRDPSLTDLQKDEVRNRQSEKLDEAGFSENRTTALVTDMNAEKLATDSKSDMAFQTPSERKAYKKEAKKLAQKATEKRSKGEKGNVEFMADTTEKVSNKLNDEDRRLYKTQRTLEHQIANSKHMEGLFQRRMQSPKAYSAFMAERDSNYKKMEISRGAKFTKNEVAELKAKLDPLLKANTDAAINNLMEEVLQLRDTTSTDFTELVQSVKSDRLEAATGTILDMWTSDPHNHAAVSEMIKNSDPVLKKAIHENFNLSMDKRTEDALLPGTGNEYKEELTASILQNMNSVGLTQAMLNIYGASGQVRINSIYSHIRTAAEKDYFSNSGIAAKALGQATVKKLFKDTMIMVGNKHGGLMMPKKNDQGITNDNAGKIIERAADTKTWNVKGLQKNPGVQEINRIEGNTGAAADARAKELLESGSLGIPYAVQVGDKVFRKLKDSRNRPSTVPDNEEYLFEAKKRAEDYVEPTIMEGLMNFLKVKD